MTKGTSTRRKNRLPGSLYGNFDPGNNDKLTISYRREPSHDYTMDGACGVLFEEEIHFFGGDGFKDGFERQHFLIETKRSGQLVKITKKKDLEIGFDQPSCSSFEITSEYFPWFRTNVIILCFDYKHKKSCYSFDGTLNYIGDSNHKHQLGGLTKYKEGLLTVGDSVNQKTEILKMDENKNLRWSVIEPDFKFIQGDWIYDHSLVTVESRDVNEEYVLLIGGFSDQGIMNDIFKFNGTWFPFGQLNKPRCSHYSIYWNGAVYVIGGDSYVTGGDSTGEYRIDYDYDSESSYSYIYDDVEFKNTKMEIWNIKDSPDQFETKENWPELFGWAWPHLFIVRDSFFPDH